MNEKEEQERYRYLKLKQKASGRQQGIPGDSKPSLGSQAMGWAKMPEKMLGATLDVAKQQIPTKFGKGAMNVLSNTMPSTVSPLNLALMGGLEGTSAILPKLGPFASGAAEQLESLAGSPKGTLARGFSSAKNMFGPGRKIASPVYESSRPFTTHPELADVFENKELVEKSLALAKQGKLSPFEAFNARRGVDKLYGKSGYSDDALEQIRQTFDGIAKSDKKIAVGDVLSSGGRKNEALRTVFPKNKYGSTSGLKTAIMAGVPGAGLALSPIVQGIGATGLGAGVRGLNKLASNPELIAVISSLIKNLQQSKNQNGQTNP